MSNGSLFFTAPWDPPVVRRGDALGLRAFTDVLAETVAPDFSNRIIDGRWITILSWCLVRSHDVYHTGGGQIIMSRAQQSQRYAWLRPLELMWVARTMHLLDNDYQGRGLAGQRSVSYWRESGNSRLAKFGMSKDQFHAYRQTGIYGGYRLAFRRWPNMTVRGDGWTPGPATIELAKWLESKLRNARPDWKLSTSNREGGLSSKSVSSGIGKEDEWWLRKWNNYREGYKSVDIETLPRYRNDYAKLPEYSLLKPLIFGGDKAGQKRLRVVREISKASAQNHIGLCDHLARAFADEKVIAVLPHFSRLADAGMDAMDFVANVLRRDSNIPLSDLAKRKKAKTICKKLSESARLWNQLARPHLDGIDSVNNFASKMQHGNPLKCLKALLLYHEESGGGLRWFVLRAGRVEPKSPPSSIGSARYRFRLWPLARLASQCGILQNMPRALQRDLEVSEVDMEENADE